jgi:hypothetical protein
MSALASPRSTRELRQLLEPFTRPASMAGRELRVDRVDLGGAVMRSWPIDGGRREQRGNGDIVELQPMLQATRSFVATYGGERVQINLDTRVAVGHEIARAHPGWFRPVDDPVAGAARSRSRSVTTKPRKPAPKATPAASRPKTSVTPVERTPDADIVLRDTPGRATASISARSYQAIADECKRFAHLKDIETGGFLAGPTARSWDTSIQIMEACGPGARSKHLPNRMKIDLGGYADLERDFAWADADIGEIGFWHSHPSFGSTKPSQPDLAALADCWNHVQERRGAGLYLGLIASPSNEHGPWSSPRLDAYVVRRGEYKGLVCEPVPVNIWGQHVPTWIAP